jgi:nucleoporin NUP42
MGAKPAFGQSAFGQASQPAFGQASKPAFGQASAAGSPSPFAAAASQPSGFAQAGQQQPATGFGQPSAFGAASGKPSPFAAAGSAQQQQQSPFAAASNNNATPPPSNPFGGSSQSAFGQPSQPAAKPNPFSSGASANNTPNPAFGQPTQPATSAFGQPSQPAASGNNNPFGQNRTPQQPNGNGASPAPPAAAGSTPTAGPDPSTYLTLSASQQPISFKNQAVTTLSKDDGKPSFHVYQSAANNGQPEHLWFPTGPPPAKKDTQLGEEDVFYSGALGKELQAIYEAVASQGAFVGGVMPEVPPRREWVRFDI